MMKIYVICFAAILTIFLSYQPPKKAYARPLEVKAVIEQNVIQKQKDTINTLLDSSRFLINEFNKGVSVTKK